MTEVEHAGRVGVFGATSLVGACLLPTLVAAGWPVTAWTRQSPGPDADGVQWRSLGDAAAVVSSASGQHIASWICVAPIWVLPAYFKMLEAHGARRVVALSSTSRFTKDDSSDLQEQAIARRLVEAEEQLQDWAQQRGIEWVILRPTLIYGLGRDKNVAEIARVIRRFGIFPLFGKATGLRQPVHAADVAQACSAALRSPTAANRTYNIAGGETLGYREMVSRIFSALGRTPRLVTVPLWLFAAMVMLLRRLPRYRQWTTAMAQRMNRDLVFDHAEAMRDLSFRPRPFAPSAADVDEKRR
ncbi:nucleoside-diphosphate-sugar epimerase [Actimicrobium sp. GrIS 1.19]|uniref:NAD-dependent epimerase/dehydratase family protein n=1 Tax=Actimicrobium sp. GrIS 1.19 TaxID=3071708 RepID=UPI002E06A79A|nr:nucleoside-diphosphate-sugar epimerase [Actimicrobium sp. GrIS 1.19]